MRQTELRSATATFFDPTLGAGTDLRFLLRTMLDAALELTGAQRGNLQLLDHGGLRIAVHRDHSMEFLRFFELVEARGSACGEALARGDAVLVPNVVWSPIFTPSARDAMLREGSHAVISVPLVLANGRMAGIVSVHYTTPRLSAEPDLELLRRLAARGGRLMSMIQDEKPLAED
ncbi:GAF domain-containing protein [Actinomadura barringtoniae]|uniref:GAF domain-containing protein n=1 Tax=Actinomadura barringtoniae TaxID=1427535 RepID=A0A939P971_9ACTN|nr:GAF domain-containing protein [Actinomadura barringtoniae]MBO2448205.1 GAF domain-containing protein [Actinomadura barringtoniae]